ncbi:hypothetical protein [Roseovarius aestuariivivens]|uniref:hypothetical protein n=1 Tax=Roseovarius aestuariivivens TaxID=1888910 RepID=UPI001081602D|nr:hypothetical protein [Roseovarius aestuariivivens]
MGAGSRFITLALWLIGLSAGVAQAQAQTQDCPTFFRFVDFGLRAGDARLHRGGVVFRAEDFDGQTLLLRDRALCMHVAETSKDGRGNPIPVVSRIEYYPAATGLELLRITRMPDAVATAEKAAAQHHGALTETGTRVARGVRFLCVQQPDAGTLSCQVVSPFLGLGPLTVYCDAARCDMPALAIHAHLTVTAAWPRAGKPSPDLETTGARIADRVDAIHGFLAPISSGL